MNISKNNIKIYSKQKVYNSRLKLWACKDDFFSVRTYNLHCIFLYWNFSLNVTTCRKNEK